MLSLANILFWMIDRMRWTLLASDEMAPWEVPCTNRPLTKIDHIVSKSRNKILEQLTIFMQRREQAIVSFHCRMYYLILETTRCQACNIEFLRGFILSGNDVCRYV